MKKLVSCLDIYELSKLLGIDAGTVRRYIDLLEKSFVLFHLASVSRNIRIELKKSTKAKIGDLKTGQNCELTPSQRNREEKFSLLLESQ